MMACQKQIEQMHRDLYEDTLFMMILDFHTADTADRVCGVHSSEIWKVYEGSCIRHAHISASMPVPALCSCARQKDWCSQKEWKHRVAGRNENTDSMPVPVLRSPVFQKERSSQKNENTK
jgi:hypothetical protein